jgi:hypothetical protein
MGALMLARGAVTQDSFLPRNTVDLIDICSAGQSDLFYTAATNLRQGFVVRVHRVVDVAPAGSTDRSMDRGACP